MSLVINKNHNNDCRRELILQRNITCEPKGLLGNNKSNFTRSNEKSHELKEQQKSHIAGAVKNPKQYGTQHIEDQEPLNKKYTNFALFRYATR